MFRWIPCLSGRAAVFACLLVLSPLALANQSGVILIYHHVSEDTPASTSVTPEKFERHLQYLEDNDFTVWPVERLLEYAQAGRDIPERTVAITFDDAYKSVKSEAMPRLQARDWPFSVFVATQYVDDGLSNYLSWDELREMEQQGVTMANHTVSHAHLARARSDESESAWLARVEQEIAEAQQRLEAELADPVKIFAWPYGESSPAAEEVLLDLDYLGLGQHSGGVGPHSNFASVPRYPMATGFDDLDDFSLKVRSRPLPVIATDPESRVLEPEESHPEVVLTLGEGQYRADQINCYSRGQVIDVEQVSDDPLTLRISSERGVNVGRTPFNCTAPAQDANAWYWFSHVWMRPQEDGSWYGW